MVALDIVSEVQTVLGSLVRICWWGSAGGLCCRTESVLSIGVFTDDVEKGLIIKQITGSYLPPSLPLVSLETLFLVNFLNCINIKLRL